MGVSLVCALLVAIQLFSSTSTRGVLPVFFQLQPSPKGYGDSPRPRPASNSPGGNIPSVNPNGRSTPGRAGKLAREFGVSKFLQPGFIQRERNESVNNPGE
jgi:hypothetical protein